MATPVNECISTDREGDRDNQGILKRTVYWQMHHHLKRTPEKPKKELN